MGHFIQAKVHIKISEITLLEESAIFLIVGNCENVELKKIKVQKLTLKIYRTLGSTIF